MKAAVYHAPGDIRTEEVAVPEPGPRDVLLAIKAVGICGSDLHMYRKGMYGIKPGLIMGHEFSGEAVEVGTEVEGVEIGRRYTGFTIDPCGECWWCERRMPRLCPHLFEGYSGFGKNGAMAEYMLIEDAVLDENLFRVPDHLPDDEAALAEPLGTAVYASLRAKPQDGDQVIVIGAGVIGMLLVQAFKAAADVRVIVTEVSPQRGERALSVGADVVVDARREDLLDAVIEATGEGAYAFGRSGMADIVVDAAAAPPTFGQALQFVRSKGTVLLIGSPESPSPVDTGLIVNKDVRVMGAFGSIIPKGMGLLEAGRIATGPLISHRFSLDDAAEAFRVAASGEGAKVMLFPAGDPA